MTSYSGKWQATDRTPDDAVSIGSWLAHLSVAFQQRVRKTQPLGGLIGLGRSPSRRIRLRVRSALGSGCGAADSKAFVYGCFGLLNISEVLPISTIFPRYITATRSEMCLTTDKSWAIKITPMPSSRLKSANRLIT